MYIKQYEKKRNDMFRFFFINDFLQLETLPQCGQVYLGGV